MSWNIFQTPWVFSIFKPPMIDLFMPLVQNLSGMTSKYISSDWVWPLTQVERNSMLCGKRLWATLGADIHPTAMGTDFEPAHSCCTALSVQGNTCPQKQMSSSRPPGPCPGPNSSNMSCMTWKNLRMSWNELRFTILRELKVESLSMQMTWFCVTKQEWPHYCQEKQLRTRLF